MITLAALCAVGAEKILSNEIRQLGYKALTSVPGRVIYSGDKTALFRSNLCLRTADRVYMQLASFPAADFDALFEGVTNISWQDFFKKDTRIIVDKVRIKSSRLSSEHSVQSIVHKAIYTKLGAVWRMATLPETGAQASVRVYLEKDQVTVLLDLSGEPLHKRGYRTSGGEAPLRETLAAVLLHQMLWRRKTPLHDPFCGSGTIATEAVLYAYNIAPGFGRSFALESLAIYNPEEAAEMRKEEAAKIVPENLARITGTDKDPAAIERAKLNAEHACVTAGRALQLVGSDKRIQRPDFDLADFTQLEAPYEKGLILSNPPYGQRMGNLEETENLYRSMGSLFETFPGWDMGFITAHQKFESCLGKRATAKKNIKGGNLDTIFYMYTQTGDKKNGHHS